MIPLLVGLAFFSPFAFLYAVPSSRASWSLACASKAAWTLIDAVSKAGAEDSAKWCRRHRGRHNLPVQQQLDVHCLKSRPLVRQRCQRAAALRERYSRRRSESFDIRQATRRGIAGSGPDSKSPREESKASVACSGPAAAFVASATAADPCTESPLVPWAFEASLVTRSSPVGDMLTRLCASPCRGAKHETKYSRKAME